MTGPDSRLTELFQRASSLEGSELEHFLAELERGEPRLAGELRELLEFDARGGALRSEARPDLAARALDPGSDALSAEYVKKLAQLSPPAARYKLEGKITEGGQGAILRAWDESLRRHLAMKVVLGTEDALAKGPTPPVDARTLGRFLEEAQVTGQLDHPGVVPVHELAVNGEGTVYFTMRLVKGESLSEVFALVLEGKEGWNKTRALSVILKVCETMSYAHSKGVIHRDLKPGNVMVGKYGEVYVMDWGLARIQGRKDDHDLRIRPASTGSIHSERADQRVASPDSPVITVDGTVLGTPSYMSPEQGMGRVEELGARSDVYGVGAMLYELLTGQAPYVPPGARLAPHVILAMLVQGPPKPVHVLNAAVPAELQAICEKAMARKSADRYADMQALAEDLRAYLERRVVRAYETGAVAELRKWVARNKPLAASLAAAFVLLVAGLTTSLVFKARSDRRTDEVLRLSALQRLDDLIAEADRLWPARPENVPKFEEWLLKASALVGERADHERTLAKLRARGSAPTPLEAGIGRSEWTFAHGQDRWWHNQLAKLIEGLEELQGGLLAEDTISVEHGWSLPKRLAFARTIEERSLSGTEAKALWAEAIVSIRDEAHCPAYGGLVLTPQLGLLPLGPDLDSGLWEFAHLQTGTPAVRGADGKLILNEETGIAFVLLPGGTFQMGAQKSNPEGANYDPQAAQDEGPVHAVTLSPFFLSKYEMTQGQWLRFTGRNPSAYKPDYPLTWNRSGRPGSLLHPVEQVSWTDCVENLGRLDLALPSEAQWEYGCRAGTDSAFWCGDDPAGLQGVANLSDAYGKSHGNGHWPSWEAWLDDGQTVHAEVGSYRANAFGLHDVHGNVWEWCMDGYRSFSEDPTMDPLSSPLGAEFRSIRGGGWDYGVVGARSANRPWRSPGSRVDGTGLRVARALEALAR